MMDRKNLKALLIVLAIFISLWGCADLFFSIYEKKPAQPTATNEYIKGLGSILRRGYQSNSYTINSLGLRGDELLPQVSQEVRILVLGDSVAFGVGLEQGHDWPAQLEKYLRKQGVAATVLNGAQSGTTYQYAFEALKYFHELIKFDLVIVHATGNLYALSRSEKNIDIAMSNAGQQLFPLYKQKNLAANSDCASYPDNAVNKEISHLPIWLKKLSTTSTALNVALNYLESIFKKTATSPSLQKNQCYQYGGSFLETEMLATGRLLQYANDKQLPIILIKPSYAYGWQHKPSANTLKKLNLPQESNPLKFKKVNSTIADFFTFFEKYSLATFIDPIRSYESNSQPAENDASIKNLYSDYTHYSAQGAELIAKTVGQELIAKHILAVTVKGEWQHPNTASHTPIDLQYKELPASLSKSEIIYSAFMTLMVFSLIGAAARLLLFKRATKYALLTPLLGSFTLSAGHLFFNNFEINYGYYFTGLIFLSSCLILYQIARRKIRIQANISYLIALLLISAVCSNQIYNSLDRNKSNFSQKTFSHYINNIKSEIAWAEYLATPKEKRPSQHKIYVDELSDGKVRPDYVPGVISVNSEKTYPTAMNIAILQAKASHISMQNMVIGIHIAFFISLFIAMLAIFNLFIRKKSSLIFLSTALAFISLQFVARLIPTQFLTFILSSCLLIGIVLFANDVKHQYIKYLLLLIGGSALYTLPGQVYMGLIAAVIVFICLQTYLASGKIKTGLSACAITLLCLLSARVALFNMPISDPHFYKIAADLHVPNAFMKNKVVNS